MKGYEPEHLRNNDLYMYPAPAAATFTMTINSGLARMLGVQVGQITFTGSGSPHSISTDEEEEEDSKPAAKEDSNPAAAAASSDSIDNEGLSFPEDVGGDNSATDA